MQLSQLDMYESVDKERVRGHEEWLAIARIVPKISEFAYAEHRWHEDFNMECFIIADHIDFICAETFNNHERRDQR